MPSIFTPSPAEIERKEPGIGGKPPVDRRPTGGGGGGGDDEWNNERRGPRELLHRVRFFVLSALAADMIFFAVLVLFFFARQAGFHMDPRTHEFIGDWRPVLLPRILYLNTLILLLSSVTMERARQNIFREIDVLEEWLGLGTPALRRWSTPASYFFYVITGLHAAHLVIGVLALILCLSVLGWLKRVEYRQVAVDSTAWFWHTMSVAWLVLFGVLALGQ